MRVPVDEAGEADASVPDRAQAVVTACQFAMYRALTQAREPLSYVAESFGKTPATVLHHVKTIKGRLKNELDLCKEVNAIVANVLRHP